ncbi:MAG: hypothetical protein PWR16_266 [Methanoculleus sp.]|nr:hypothetical protein [Methanoculleus sp.]
MDQSTLILLIFYSLLVFSILIFAFLGLVSGKLSFEIYLRTTDKKRINQFYNSLIKLFQNDPTDADIVDLYKILFNINEQNPIFIPKLRWLLKNFKVLLIEGDERYVPNDFDPAILKEWRARIDPWIVEIERKYPFSGLSKQDWLFFNDLSLYIESGENEAAKEVV